VETETEEDGAGGEVIVATIQEIGPEEDVESLPKEPQNSNKLLRLRFWLALPRLFV